MLSDMNIMEIHTDFKELLELFSLRAPQDNKHRNEYRILQTFYWQILIFSLIYCLGIIDDPGRRRDEDFDNCAALFNDLVDGLFAFT